ncbi:MAG: DNA polymerase Y family protein [Solirubrobacterales bacterium]
MPRFELTIAAGQGGIDRQELLARPVALAPTAGGRQTVGQVSAAAEAFAVTPGLPLGEAFARCPQLKLVAPDPAAARSGWERVLQGLEAFGAEVESNVEAPGTAFFESSGLEPLHRGFDGVLAAIRDAIGRPVRIGAAQSRFVALAAARTARPRKPKLVLSDLDRRDFLANAPIGWLALYDEQLRQLADTLEKLGIETLGEFALLRRARVAERFGVAGLTARDLIYGQEPPLRPRRPAERLTERIELIDDAEGQTSSGAMAGDLERALTLLIERLLARPERKQRTLRAVTVSAHFTEGGSWSAGAIMRQPTADPARIKLVAQRKLLDLPAPAAALELTADGFGPLDHESATLFGKDSSRERARRLRHAAEQARQAAGSPQSVARVVKLDENSRLPERRAALSPGPVPLSRPKPAVGLKTSGEGAPVRLRGRPVTSERERWVVEDRWWTGRPVRRRYFELVLADGSNVVVFQDLGTRNWFEQRA